MPGSSQRPWDGRSTSSSRRPPSYSSPSRADGCHNAEVTQGDGGLSVTALEIIAAGAEEADRSGYLPAASFEALRSTGLLAAKLPKELGGADSSLLELFDRLEAVA